MTKPGWPFVMKFDRVVHSPTCQLVAGLDTVPWRWLLFADMEESPCEECLPFSAKVWAAMRCG